MKTITTALALVIVFVMTALQINVNAQTIAPTAPQALQQYQDGELLAQAYLNNVFSYYQGSILAVRVTNGISVSVNITFVMGADLWITNMTVDGTQIPITKPLSGIPIPASGYQSFDLYIAAYDSNGYFSGDGQFATNALLPGDVISVIIQPVMPPSFIALAVSNPSQLSVFVSGNTGSGWYYDQSRGGIVLDPGNGLTDADYVVTDQNGNVLVRGHYRAYTAPSTTMPETTVNIQQAGGVQKAQIGPNGYYYSQTQVFDSQTVRSNVWLTAKIFNVPNLNRSRLYFQTQNDDGVSVEVHRPNATGQMALVATQVTYDEGGYTVVISDEYLDNAVVTVFPANIKATMKPFSVYVSRY